MSIDCKKMYIFADVSGEKSTDARKHFVLSPNLKFAKFLTEDRSNQCSFCVYTVYVCSTHRLCVYSTAWEYCFFIVHSDRAFGDA